MEKYKNKIATIMALAIEVSEKTKAEVFAKYSGHVDLFEVEIYPDSWENRAQTAEDKFEVWHTDSDVYISKTLDNVISKLNELLKWEEQK